MDRTNPSSVHRADAVPLEYAAPRRPLKSVRCRLFNLAAIFSVILWIAVPVLAVMFLWDDSSPGTVTVSYHVPPPSVGQQVFGLVVLLAVLVVVLAVILMPFVWVWNYLRERKRDLRIVEGKCHSCGYDLRESKERCPECGTAITTTPAT